MIKILKPMHFTKKQKKWIEAYVILKKQEAKAEAIGEIHTELITEMAMLNEAGITDANLYTFAVRIKEIADKLVAK